MRDVCYYCCSYVPKCSLSLYVRRVIKSASGLDELGDKARISIHTCFVLIEREGKSQAEI
jgi:hypothetical protein